ncbi:terpenoid synthase [Colletotrichum somersetense]|nr:terpenoid synthase [Colletotrichum somersetense]
MSLLQVDPKRALGFCDAQILLGADKFFCAVRNADKMADVSYNVRLYMAKLKEYLPAELVLNRSSLPARPVQQAKFMLLFGRYFQIRDDFSNLASEQYSKAKGFCEDLDEGKCSFIIPHAMNHSKPQSRALLRNIFLQRRNGSLSVGHKEMVLNIIQEANSLHFAKEAMIQLEVALLERLNSLEMDTGVRNMGLRALMDALRT